MTFMVITVTMTMTVTMTATCVEKWLLCVECLRTNMCSANYRITGSEHPNATRISGCAMLGTAWLGSGTDLIPSPEFPTVALKNLIFVVAISLNY